MKFRLILKHQTLTSKVAPKPQSEEIRRVFKSEPSFFLREIKHKSLIIKPVYAFMRNFSCIFIVIEPKYLRIYSTKWTSPEDIVEFLNGIHKRLIEYQVEMMLSGKQPEFP